MAGKKVSKLSFELTSIQSNWTNLEYCQQQKKNKGDGIGAHSQGMVAPIKASLKFDQSGVSGGTF